MKVAEMGGGEAGVAEYATPTIADNYALVKVWTAPLCTEFKHRHRERRGGFGHEAAGEVVEVGPAARAVSVGDRVVVMPANACGVCPMCQSGEHIYCQSKRNPAQICGCKHGRETTQQYVVQQDWMLVKIPDGVSYDHAGMACCGLGPGFNANASMEVGAGETVLVSGLGPVGLGAATVALFRGATVVGVDVNPYRRELVQKLGAIAAFDPTEDDAKDKIIEATGGRGIQKCVDTSGAEPAARFLVKVVRPRGRVAFIAQSGTLDVGPLVHKGLRIYGCWHWNHYQYAELMMATIAGSAERIDTMITHTFPIERIAEAFALQDSGQCGKVVIHPWG